MITGINARVPRETTTYGVHYTFLYTGTNDISVSP